MSWDGLQGSRVTYAESPVESARFGLTMARLTVGRDVRPDGPAAEDADRHPDLVTGAAAEVTDRLRAADADVVVVRYPAQSLGLAAAVASSGRDVLAAGSLTYWSAPASAIRVPQPAEGLEVVPLAQHTGDAEGRAAVVDAVVADSFGGYGNHYSANPLLDPEASLAGYQEWARRSALADPADALLLVLRGDAVGLATLVDGERPKGAGGPGEDPSRGHVEVLLAGLRTAAQGQGRYATLFGGVAREALARGRPEVVISTQSHNVRVQRSWARLGLRPFAAVETVHAVRPGLIA